MERLKKLEALYSVDWSVLSALGVEVEGIENVERITLVISGVETPGLKVVLVTPAFPWRVQHLALVDGAPQVVIGQDFGTGSFQVKAPHTRLLPYQEQTQPL